MRLPLTYTRGNKSDNAGTVRVPRAFVILKTPALLKATPCAQNKVRDDRRA